MGAIVVLACRTHDCSYTALRQACFDFISRRKLRSGSDDVARCIRDDGIASVQSRERTHCIERSRSGCKSCARFFQTSVRQIAQTQFECMQAAARGAQFESRREPAQMCGLLVQLRASASKVLLERALQSRFELIQTLRTLLECDPGMQLSQAALEP